MNGGRTLTLKDLEDAKKLLEEYQPDPSTRVACSFRCGSERVYNELSKLLAQHKPGDLFLAMQGAIISVDERVPEDEIHAVNVYGNVIGICVLKEKEP